MEICNGSTTSVFTVWAIGIPWIQLISDIGWK
jgi:hypothetical protein